MRVKITYEVYLDRLLSKFGSKIVCLEPIKGVNVLIKHKCIKNHVFLVKPNDLLNQKYGCFKCYHQTKGINSRKTQQYLSELNKIHKGLIIPIEKYITALTKIKHKCSRGHIFCSTPNSLLSGYGCEKCSYIERGISRRKTDKEYIKLLKERTNGKFISLEPYKGIATKILHKCMTCTNKWEVIPDSLLMGQGCPACKINNHYSTRYGKKDYQYGIHTIQIQGYENQALDILKSKKYKFTDIAIGAGCTPVISYRYKRKNKRHYPDIYIKTKNLLIEVKGTYTFIGHPTSPLELRKDLLSKNKAKYRAAIKQGYIYIYIQILDF